MWLTELDAVNGGSPGRPELMSGENMCSSDLLLRNISIKEAKAILVARPYPRLFHEVGPRYGPVDLISFTIVLCLYDTI